MAYAYQKYIDEQKHLDTDELRHTMKPIIHVVVQDLKGEEHKFCDKEQLCPLGKFRRPKKMMEAEEKGFASVADMMEANKKAEEDRKQQEIDDLKKQVATFTENKKAEEDKKVQEVDDLKKQLATLTAIIEKIPNKYKGL
jgi:2-methylcitrate dehydratase PrpD